MLKLKLSIGNEEVLEGLDIYFRNFQGNSLGDNFYVFDEESSKNLLMFDLLSTVKVNNIGYSSKYKFIKHKDYLELKEY